MVTFQDEIRSLITRSPGLTDREITERLRGPTALQRMGRNDARYSIALSDMPQYRRLWERLPELAKMRTRIGALFVEDAETVHYQAEYETEPELSSRCYIPSGGALA